MPRQYPVLNWAATLGQIFGKAADKGIGFFARIADLEDELLVRAYYGSARKPRPLRTTPHWALAATGESSCPPTGTMSAALPRADRGTGRQNQLVTSASFPLLLEHQLALGVVRGRGFEAPTLAAAGVLLVARGADQLLVPAPSAREREHVEAGVLQRPPERRSLVRIIDRDGDVLKRVRAYLGPLQRQAKKWPEDAFVNFAEGFLYQLALATHYRAGIAHDSVAVVRGFIRLLDPAEFKGEARFRLAELVRVICSYEPAAPEHLAWTGEIARSNYSKQVWAIFESAEFQELVAASGRIGLVRHPKVLLRRMRRLLAQVIRHPASKGLLRMGQTAADVAGAPKAVDAIGELLLAATAAPGTGDYWPPFISLGPAHVAVYQAALKMSNQHASPPPGTVMVLRGGRGGSEGVSWVNVGEEDKLEREAAEVLEARQRELRDAREAMNRFI